MASLTIVQPSTLGSASARPASTGADPSTRPPITTRGADLQKDLNIARNIVRTDQDSGLDRKHSNSPPTSSSTTSSSPTSSSPTSSPTTSSSPTSSPTTSSIAATPDIPTLQEIKGFGVQVANALRAMRYAHLDECNCTEHFMARQKELVAAAHVLNSSQTKLTNYPAVCSEELKKLQAKLDGDIRFLERAQQCCGNDTDPRVVTAHDAVVLAKGFLTDANDRHQKRITELNAEVGRDLAAFRRCNSCSEDAQVRQSEAQQRLAEKQKLYNELLKTPFLAIHRS